MISLEKCVKGLPLSDTCSVRMFLLYNTCSLCFLAEIEKHYRDHHPTTSTPEYIVEQARCERQPPVSLSDKLDNETLSTGDFSEGPNSSVVDSEVSKSRFLKY